MNGVPAGTVSGTPIVAFNDVTENGAKVTTVDPVT
jgi:hypothetical protein